jgi:hypothetical protein
MYGAIGLDVDAFELEPDEDSYFQIFCSLTYLSDKHANLIDLESLGEERL